MNTGRQKGVVLSHLLKIAGTGTLTVAVKFQVGDNEAIIGEIYITDKNMDNAESQLRAIGFDPKDDLQKLDDNHELLLGRETDIDIQEDTYNGKTRMKVVQIGEGFAVKKPTKEQIAHANKRLKQVAAGKPAPTPDDIPF